jgi:DNA-binding transcriptional ArsR family regulator
VTYRGRMEGDRPTTITDVAALRALAHPARLALLDHLTSTGPSTATECARVVALTPSATSYHLRALAKAGMVEEAPGRGDGRERFWRSRFSGYRVEGGTDEDPEVREAAREVLDTFVVREEAQVRKYLATLDDEPKEWEDAATFNGNVLLLTADELLRLVDAIREIVLPYRKRNRQDPPAGARTVAMLIRAFPTDPPLR